MICTTEEGRGSCDLRTDEEIYITKLHDNAIAVCTSNHYTHRSLQVVKRRVKRNVIVPQSHLIKYNEGKYSNDCKFYVSSIILEILTDTCVCVCV